MVEVKIKVEVAAPELVAAMYELADSLAKFGLERTADGVVATTDTPASTTKKASKKSTTKRKAAQEAAEPAAEPVSAAQNVDATATQKAEETSAEVVMATPAPVVPAPAVPDPVVPAPVVPDPVVPAPAITLSDLANAGAKLMDAGKTKELIAMLQSFGVNALTQLSEDKYPDVMAAIRAIGSK